MIDRIDHLVLTVASLDATCTFYETVLGFERVDVAGKPTALRFGRQKINVHQRDHMFEPKAATPTSGLADFWLVTLRPIPEIAANLSANGVAIEEGPIARSGAEGEMTSIYFRDPDGNLVEISRYD